MILVDEVAMWPDTRNHDRLWGALISALGKVRGSRLIVMSSAGSPSHPAFKRWNVAEASPHWRTSITPGPSPWWTEADVQAAAEQLTPAEFRRYIECQWAEADDSLAMSDDLAACTGTYRVREPVRGVTYLMAIDIGTRRDSTVLTTGHLEATAAGRRVVIDRVQRWTGSRLRPVSLADVETALVATWRSYHRPKLRFDFHQAAQLVERLQAAGVRTEEYVFSTSGVNKLARSLFAALRDRAVLLPDVEDLIAELGKVRLVETGPGLVRLDHRSGEHDDQAVTIGMLTASLLERPSGTMRVRVPVGRIPATTPAGRAREAEKQATSPTVVGQDGQRPADRLLRFQNARRHPGYTPPRPR
jgi:hypothetical protein